MSEDSIIRMTFTSDVVQFAVGRKAIEMMMTGRSEAPTLTITTEGVRSNVERLLGGMNDSLSVNVPIFGGTASDHFTMLDTRQIFNGQVLEAAVVLCFFGPLKVDSGVPSGWKTVGRRMRIPSPFYPSADSEEHTLRGALQVDAENGLLHVATDMPQGMEGLIEPSDTAEAAVARNRLPACLRRNFIPRGSPHCPRRHGKPTRLFIRLLR